MSKRKMKVKPTNIKLWGSYAKIVSVISAALSLFLAFFDFTIFEKPNTIRWAIAGTYVGILLVVFVILLICANRQKKVTMQVDDSVVHIKVGDIFEQPDIKVIGFNEYFDTEVNDVIIARNTLNGQYLLNHRKSTDDLDKAITDNPHMKECVVKANCKRTGGKTTKYELGSIHKDGDYFLLAFTHFDKDNRAYLTLREYTACLMNMWEEIDKQYNGRSVAIPLLGSGITRRKDFRDVSDQELLEIILWTFKISRVKFRIPISLSIILHQNNIDEINFYKLKGVYDDIQN